MAKRKKGQTDKQRSTKHYTESKRPNNTNPNENRDELRCSGRVSSSCSTCDTSRVAVKRYEHHLKIVLDTSHLMCLTAHSLLNY